MNFAGPFDARSLTDSPVSLGGEGFSFGAKPGFVQHHPSDAYIVIPDAHLLFSGTYVRIGNDLIISGADQKFVVGNYFKGETRPSLSSADGATLSGQIVDALTGHVHVAQAGAAPAAAQVIGHVLKMSGSATAVRNGVSIELHIGDAVQKGDVIQTGSDSSIGMTFVDGSAFGMTSNARMVLNEMIYDPNGSSNSSLISLVQGTITFVAGQTAKNGNMRVETPVATMGIRGTAVLVEIAADNGPTKFSVLVEPDGHTGSYNLYDKASGQLIGTVSQAGQVTFVSVGGIGQPPTAIEQLKTLQDQQQEKALIQQVFQLYFPNYNPDNSNPKSQKFGSTSYNNLAEITFTTTTNQQHTFLTQIELRFAVTDPVTGVVTYQNRIFYNTKAQFSAIPVFGDQAFSSINETFKFMDVVRIDDPDIGNGPFYDIGVPFVAGSALILSAISTTTAPSEAALKDLLTINQTTGEVTFNRHDFNFLDDGETVKYIIRVTATSGPDTGYVEIPVTITGANDVPLFGTPVAVELHEIGIVPPETVPPTNGDGVLQETITLHFTDADFSETGSNYAVDVSAISTTGSTAGFAPATLEATLRDFFSFAATPVTKDVNHTDGYIHGTFHAADKAFDYLAEGEQLVITYTVELTEQDYGGAHFYQSFTVTITGSNDVPTITVGEESQADTIYELPGQTGGTGFDHNVNNVTPFGSIHFADADLTDRPEATITSQIITYLSADQEDDLTNTLMQAQRDAIEDALKLSVPIGQNANTNNGVVDWTYKLVDNVLDFLAEDETITLVSTVRISDGHGGFVDATVTINIVGGANDTPSVSAISDVAFVEQTDTTPRHQDIAVSFTDVDLSDTGHTASVQSVSATGTLPPSTPTGSLTSGALFGLLTAVSAAKAAGGSSGSASFSFDADSTVFDYLAFGETIVLTYTVGITDPHGAMGTQTVKVTVTGTNDVPVFTSESLSGAITETDGTPVTSTPLTDSGVIKFTDVDLSDTHAVSAMGTFVASHPGDVALGTLSAVLDSDTSHTTGVGGQLTWTYSVDPEKVEYLAAGEHLVEQFTITIDDGANGPITKTISVDIVGINDVPVVTVGTPAADTEGNTGASDVVTVTVADHVTITDVDVSDVPAPYAGSLAFDALNSTGPAPSGGALADLFTVNQADGTISYDRAAFDYLAGGEHVVAKFTFVSSSGPDHDIPQSITVTVDGANDAPVIETSNVYLTNNQDGTTTVVGLSVSDPDGGGNSQFTVTTTTDGHGTILPAGGEDTLSTINSALQTGVVYTPADMSTTGKITMTITDEYFASDTVNFIFKQYGSGGVELTSTADKDVLIGGVGADQFIFNASFGRDIIVGFDLDHDVIKVDNVVQTINDLIDHAVAANGTDTLITPDASHPADTILLKGVAYSQLLAHGGII